MAARKKRKAKPRSPATRGVSRYQQQQKRKSNGRQSNISKRAKPKRTAKPSASKRSAKGRATAPKRSARKQRSPSRNQKQTAKRGRRLREAVERSTRPKLKRSKQGGLREYQGPTFDRTKFGNYKGALKSVGEEAQHAYDEAVESLREGLDNDASEATIKRRRNKVRRLAAARKK